MSSPMRLCPNGRRPGSTLAGLLVACVLTFLPLTAHAGQNAHAVPPSGDGSFKLHGHWVIEVRNPDGTFAARREFDNALTESGKAHIVQVLLRAFTAGPWGIQLGSTLADGPCEGMSFVLLGRDSCYAVDRSLIGSLGSASLPPSAFPTLTKSVGGPGGSQLILAGHITVKTPGQIDRVATIQGPCSGQSAPSNCAEFNGSTAIVTFHDLRDPQGASAPIPVVPDQIVQVTVTLSFCGSEGCQS